MDVKEIKMITALITDEVEIWVEVNGKKLSIYDYDFELEDNRLVLKAFFSNG